MHFDAEFFVAVGFTIFVLVLLWVGAHSKFTALLDGRINRIKSELAEAERLRAEAETLLASFEQKRAAAEAEAKSIVAQAKDEAEMIAAEGRRRLDEFMARSVKQVEQKIAQAEAQAAAEVRAAAADAAVVAEFGAKDAAQVLDDGERLVHQERGLVDDGDALEIADHVESGRVPAGELGEKAGAHRGIVGGDELAEAAGLVEVAHNDGGGVAARVGERRFRFLVLVLAMDDDGVAFAPVGTGGFPDFFHEHAGGVVVADGDAFSDEPALVVVGRAEGRDDHDVIPCRSGGSGGRGAGGLR